MEKWTLHYRIFDVDSFIKNNYVKSVQPESEPYKVTGCFTITAMASLLISGGGGGNDDLKTETTN